MLMKESIDNEMEFGMVNAKCEWHDKLKKE